MKIERLLFAADVDRDGLLMAFGWSEVVTSDVFEALRCEIKPHVDLYRECFGQRPLACDTLSGVKITDLSVSLDVDDLGLLVAVFEWAFVEVDASQYSLGVELTQKASGMRVGLN